MTTTSFANSKNLIKANQLKALGLYPFFRAIEHSDGSSVTVRGKRQVMIGSNNYLGLTHHPHVIEKTQNAVAKYGTGCTGSRFLNGNLSIHEELEERLATYLGQEKAIVFATGMQANLGAISALAGPKDVMFSDMENHASIIDGTRLAYGHTIKFKHNDMEDLERLLQDHRSKYGTAVIIADGVFSMTGKLVKLNPLVALAKKYNCIVYLDDAHGLGVMGDLGKGTAHYFNCHKDVHVTMGTFSKSFATVGGVISGSHDVIDYIKHAARSFMFSAAMPPSAVATVDGCLDVIESDSTLYSRLWSNVSFMQKGLTDIGFQTFGSQTPIIPILIGDDLMAMKVTKFLEDNGVFATPVISPAVPQGQALIRTSYMASHKPEDLQYCLEVFEKVAKTFPIQLAEKRETFFTTAPVLDSCLSH